MDTASSHGSRAVISGIGVIGPLGTDVGAYGNAFGHGQLVTRAAGGPARDTVVENTLRTIREPRLMRACNDQTELLLAATALAVDDAGLASGDIPSRTAVIVGLGHIEQRTADLEKFAAHLQRGTDGQVDVLTTARQCLNPLRRLKHLPNISAAVLSIQYGAIGPAMSLLGGATGGLEALLLAKELVETHAADVVLCGASDAVCSLAGGNEALGKAGGAAAMMIVRSAASAAAAGRACATVCADRPIETGRHAECQACCKHRFVVWHKEDDPGLAQLGAASGAFAAAIATELVTSGTMRPRCAGGFCSDTCVQIRSVNGRGCGLAIALARA